MPPFQDPQIQQLSHSYFCNPVSNADKHDFERPSKRARLATINDVKPRDNVRSNIVRRIYSLLGLPDNPALTGLSQNAVYVAAMSLFT